MNRRIVSAQLASERTANLEHRKLARGLDGLATVSATAPFLGMLLTVWGIVNSFPGLGTERYTALGITAGLLANSLVFAAFGVAIATFALFSRQILLARLFAFDTEMRAAVLDMPRMLRSSQVDLNAR